MKTRSNTIIGVGVVIAILGALLVFTYARGVEGRTAAAPGVEAWVAAEDLPAGTRWEDAASRMRQETVPASLRPEAAVHDGNRPVGRTSVRAVATGEVLTTTQFGAAASAPAGGLEIPPGHNGITINLPVPQGGARYAQPGDLVNVYVTFKGGAGNGEPVTKLLLSNVQVLQNRPAGTNGEQAGGEILLTMALTPDAAERVIFARETGSLWIGLVRPGDELATTGGRTFGTVLDR